MLFAILFVPAAAFAEPADEPTLTEGLRDKGVDWLKDKAKDAGEDWIFDTGQSETMHEILLKARERADGDGNDKPGLCQGAVMGKASSILNDINYAWTAKTAGKLAFDTVTKMAALASGFGGAAAEGGALDWLAGQYADAAKGQAKDAVFDKFKKLFGEEKKPEVELYETSGKNGDCDYTLRAAWDIVHGSYYVYISGDCHCASIGNAGVAPAPLGEWWISFSGHLKLVVNEDKTASWVPLDPTIDFDAQCACSKRKLKTAFANAGKTKPVPPPGPREICKACQPIQDKIDADNKAIADDQKQVQALREQLTGANGTLQSAKDKLEAVKASPGDFDITPAAVEKQVQNAQAEVDRIKRESSRLEADQVRLMAEVRDLTKQLDDCITLHCTEGHSSVLKPDNGTAVAIRPTEPRAQLSRTDQHILDVHNAERAAVGAPPLQWNARLAQDAADYAAVLARTGQLVHAPREGRGIERENIEQASPGWPREHMTDQWVAEKKNFMPGVFPMVSLTGNWSDVAHYTQMIWPTTTDLGCGSATGSGHEWLVCRYSPGGNKDGNPVG
ncbi:MAG: CAP domain-containing protein [Croceibacterium sp.]